MWDKKCKSRYINRQEIFDRFKMKHALKSCWDAGGERSSLHLRDVLATGKDRSPDDGCFIRRYRFEEDERLPYRFFDHCAYFKTMDDKVLLTAQPYGSLEEISAYFNSGWEQKNDLKAEIFGPEYSWYHEHSFLVVITLNGKE